jgi:hypothetical protein
MIFQQQARETSCKSSSLLFILMIGRTAVSSSFFSRNLPLPSIWNIYSNDLLSNCSILSMAVCSSTEHNGCRNLHSISRTEFSLILGFRESRQDFLPRWIERLHRSTCKDRTNPSYFARLYSERLMSMSKIASHVLANI